MSIQSTQFDREHALRSIARLQASLEILTGGFRGSRVSRALLIQLEQHISMLQTTVAEIAVEIHETETRG